MDPRTEQAIVASVVAGLATALGALPVLVVPRLPPRVNSALLGFGAGVMLAASAFTLLGGGYELLAHRTDATASLLVATGVLAGALVLWVADRTLPHEHFIKGHDGPGSRFVRGAWLFVLAIALHNLPEGLAVGIGFSGPDVATGYAITAGIVLQNLPEGLVAAASMAAVGLGRWRSFLVAAGTGLVELGGGLLGIVVGSGGIETVAVAMAFAGGAMLYVVGQEVIPESHVRGRERVATWGLVLGFLLMTVMDRVIR